MKKDNVLLLAMSTLPRNVSENDFIYRWNGFEELFKCESQLGPQSKAVIWKLNKRNEVLNRAVILATKEADSVDERHGMSAVDFYIEEIQKYCNKEQLNIPEFITVNLSDEGNSFEKAINGIKGNDENSKINLYIDVQGGFRSAITQINAIIELMASQNVEIIERLANNYGPGGKAPFVIQSVDNEYRTYELVTAMTMFKNYGKGQGLIDYFEGKKDSEFAGKLSKAVKLAAQSIQFCDVDGFDRAVKEISDLRNQYDANKEISELRVVANDIFDDYKMIFTAKYRYIEQIRWCLNKGYFQQALTILESKMPYEYVNAGLVYYCNNEAKKEEVLSIFEAIYNEYQDKEKYKLKDINHYYIKDYLNRDEKKYKSDKKTAIPINYGINDNTVKNSIKKYKNLCRSRNNINHASSSLINNHGFAERMKNKNDPKFKEGNTGNESLIKNINEYLREFEKLAKQVPDDIRKSIIDLA